MKGFHLAVLALSALGVENVAAFTPQTLGQVKLRVASQKRSTSVDMSSEVDVSVPYDAAARFAYDEWRQQFGKGEFNPSRYEAFKANYEAITVSNVIAKKQAREGGDENPSLLALNEYGDYTAEEYQVIMSGSSDPTSSGDLLGKAVEAAESQSEASTALQEAFDALAEEEEVRMCGRMFCIVRES